MIEILMSLIGKQLTDIVNLPGPEQIVQLDKNDRENLKNYLKEFFTPSSFFYCYQLIYNPNDGTKSWDLGENMPLRFQDIRSNTDMDWVQCVDQINIMHSIPINYSEKPTMALLRPKTNDITAAIFFGVAYGGIPRNRMSYAWEQRIGFIYLRSEDELHL